MSKIIFFASLLLLCSCSSVHFDRPMPLQGNKSESFKDLLGTYSFADTTLQTKDGIYYNAQYYKNAYKNRDSIILISGIIYFESKQVGYKIHSKAYYDMNKVDTAAVIASHKSATKSIENNYMIFDSDISETLIDLEKGDQLKLYAGNYYLSKYKKENQWEVFQVSLKEELVYLGIANYKDKTELNDYALQSNALMSIVHLEDDAFSHFVKNGGFRTRIKFKKHGPSH